MLPLLPSLFGQLPLLPDSGFHQTSPLNLLTRDQIPRTQYPNIVPPLQQIFSTPQPEAPNLASAIFSATRPKRLLNELDLDFVVPNPSFLPSI